MKDPELRAWASARQNQDFIWIYTNSGRVLSVYDPQGKDIVLGLDADENALGVAVQEALAYSRLFTAYEARKLLDQLVNGVGYEERVKALMSIHGYKSKYMMFKEMKSCSITLSKGLIEIRPSIHDRLDGWIRRKSDGIKDVVISAERPPHMIGAALRLAFTRCLESPSRLRAKARRDRWMACLASRREGKARPGT